MRKLLILLILNLCFSFGYSQVTAYPVQDMFSCDFPTYDLSSQTAVVLGSQNPSLYSVHYFLSEADAISDENSILNIQNFVGSNQYIFIRVTNLQTLEFAITTFQIVFNYNPILGDFPDVFSCNEYMLPILAVGNYFSAPDGTGTLLMAGTVIAQSMTIYVYAENSFCSSSNQFEITIENGQELSLAPLVGCGIEGSTEYGVFPLLDLRALMLTYNSNYAVSFYPTLNDAINHTNNLPNHYYTNTTPTTQTIWMLYGFTGCSFVEMIQLVVGQCSDKIISGTIRYDSQECTEASIALENIEVSSTSNTITSYAYTNSLGEYTFTNVLEGEHIISWQEANFTSSPIIHSQSVVVEYDIDDYIVNFCLNQLAPFTDISIQIIPSTNVVPGFGLHFTMILSNLGGNTESGLATFTFDNTMISFVSSSDQAVSSTSNSLTFSYNSLEPYSNHSIEINFTVLPPPAVNSGDILTISAFATTLEEDQNVGNNSLTYNYTVVNSFDPNDISVSEGPFISPEEVGEYLHYMIRFQNLGTAPAVNVRVENELDSFLDWSTFTPIAASHNGYIANRTDGNLTFHFNNINLPATEVDEPGSNGYIIYKIKPVASLAVGNIISNSANIFFDYNAAIVTNTITTQIASLSTYQNTFAKLITYPNPTSDLLSIENVPSGLIQLQLFDIGGKLIKSSSFEGNYIFDVSNVKSGLYFLKIYNGMQSVTKKLIVR